MKRSIFLAAAFILAACKDSPVGPAPSTPSVVAITSPQTVIVVGSTVNLTATVYDQDGKKITNAVVEWRSLTPTVATVSGSGVVTGVATGQATIEAKSSGRTGSITLTVDPDPCTNPINLSAGQVRMLSGPAAVACITLAPTSGSSDFLFITANAEQTQDQTAVYSVVLSGSVAGMAAAVRAMTFDPTAYAEMQSIQMVDRVEARMRIQGEDLFKRVRPAVRDAIARERTPGAALSISAAVAEGDEITLRVPDIHASNLCTTGYKEIRAAVKKVTAHAVIAQDVTSPTPGFSATDFTEIGNEFESLIYPTDTLYFGHESDRNTDGRITILYTPEVNRATSAGSPGGFIAGFFWPGDLVKKTEYQQLGIQCPQTNEQEVFYMLVPDPAGTINGNSRTVSVVRQNTRGTIAHEFQHMINQGRRLLNPAVDSSETTWLNEALSHFAEEIVGRAKRGFGDFQKLTYNDVNPTPTSPEDYQAFFRQNLLRYRAWMQRPDTTSPTSNTTGSELAPRGAAWMLLRYTTDFYSGGNMKAFLRKVVGGPDIGLRNLLQHSNAQFDDILSGWLISQFTDGLNIPGLPARYNMLSWAVRDAMSGANNGLFPLLVTPLPASIDTKSISGSGNYFRLTRVGASPQTTFRMQSPSGAMVAFPGARVYVVRIS